MLIKFLEVLNLIFIVDYAGNISESNFLMKNKLLLKYKISSHLVHLECKEIKSITLIFPLMNCVGLLVNGYVSVDFIFFPEASSF